MPIKKVMEKSRKNQNVMAVGLNYVAGVAIFFWLGYLADEFFGTQFVYKLIGTFVGIFGSTFKLIKDTQKFNESQTSKKQT